MIKFSYRLYSIGWADGTLSDDRSSVTMTASYLRDALSDLLRAAGALLDGADLARCSWEDEPGEFRWVFQRQDAEVSLKVLRFRDLYSHQPDVDGLLIFETTQSLADLATAIADGAQAVLDEHGLDGYLAKWLDHPFPIEQLATIRALLADPASRPGS